MERETMRNMKRVAVALITVIGLASGAVACSRDDERPTPHSSTSKSADVKAFKDFSNKGKHRRDVQHVVEIQASDGDVKIVTDLHAPGNAEVEIADRISTAYLEYHGPKGMWNEISVADADGKDLIVLPAGD